MREPIQQRFKSDCAVACLAMFLGVDYEDIVRHCNGYELTLSGLTDHREAFIASKFEVEIAFRDRDKLDQDKPAVLTLPSLNDGSGATHAVYWDGRRIFDPNQGRPRQRTYTNQAAWETVIDGYQHA